MPERPPTCDAGTLDSPSFGCSLASHLSGRSDKAKRMHFRRYGAQGNAVELVPGMTAGENVSHAFSVGAAKASAVTAAKAKSKAKAEAAGAAKAKSKARGQLGAPSEDFSQGPFVPNRRCTPGPTKSWLDRSYT